MRKLILIAIVFCLTTSLASAQSGTESQASSGSVYSQLGVGYPVGIASTSAASAGLLGVSFNDPTVGNIANPAHWGNTYYGLGSGGLNLHTFSASDANSSVASTDFSVNQFQLQLPIIRGKLGVSASFTPLTRTNYKNVRGDIRFIDRGTAQDTLFYRIENNGSGGVNRGELGLGWRINKYISVGYAASAVFISRDDKYKAQFADITYQQVNYRYETAGVGLGNRFGTTIRVPGLFKESDQLGFGAAVSLPVTIEASKKKKSGQVRQAMEPVDLGKGTIKMPMKVSGGVSYYPSNLLMVGMEGFYQGWSNYRNDFNTAAQSGVSFVDQYKVGMGMQYFPYVTGSDKFLSNFKYRLGASYDTGHLNIKSERINTLKFSLGLGIRSPNSSSSIDLSVEYGLRGTNAMNLVKEQIWGVKLSLNLAEVMFFRPKLK